MNARPFSNTITADLVDGWQSLPLGNPAIRVDEVYVTVPAGTTLPVLAVGNFADFDDTTPPQQCGYYFVDAVVAAGSPGPGFRDVVDEQAGTSGGSAQRSYLGVKATGAVSGAVFTIKGLVVA